MKKSLIALAVAGAMTAPMIAQANSTISGLVETRLVGVEDQDLDLGATKVQLGVQGTVDNDIDGLETGYQIEWRFNADTADADAATSNDGVQFRKAHAWLAGGFGRLDFGRQNNPSEVGEVAFGSRNGGAFQDNQDRIGNAIVYYTPDFGGFQAIVGVGLDDDLDGGSDNSGAVSPEGDDVDVTSLGLTYSGMGVNAGLGYYNAGDDYELTTLGLTYSMDGFTVGGSYGTRDQDASSSSSTGDYDTWLVGASFRTGAVQLYAEYEDRDFDAASATDNDKALAGVWYHLGSRAKVGLEYADYDVDGSDNWVAEYEVSF